MTDENGEPLAGANVMIKGTKKGTITDANGNFTLNGVQGDVLVISSVGFETQEVKVKGRSELGIAVLKVSRSELDEVVVNKGYYYESKRLSTGNVSTVKAEEIEKQPVNNPLLALQGRVPGLEITQTTGIPGGAVKVQIRGQNSIGIYKGNDPFIVIDGVPYPADNIFLAFILVLILILLNDLCIKGL